MEKRLQNFIWKKKDVLKNDEIVALPKICHSTVAQILSVLFCFKKNVVF